MRCRFPINNLDSVLPLPRNRGENRARHWIMITPPGDPARQTPRDAIGAIVFCTPGGVGQQGEVRWPNGAWQMCPPPAVSQLIRIGLGQRRLVR